MMNLSVKGGMIFLSLWCVVFTSCIKNKSEGLIDKSEQKKIKNSARGSLGDYELINNENSLDDFLRGLHIEGEYYNAIYKGVLIKYADSGFGFDYTIVKGKGSRIYFIGFEGLKKAVQYHNNIVRSKNFSYSWNNWEVVNSNELKTLNEILRDQNVFKSRHDVLSFIKILYSTENFQFSENFTALFRYVSDYDQVQNWLKNHYSANDKENMLIMDQLMKLNVFDPLTQNFLLVSDRLGLCHFTIADNDSEFVVSCQSLYPNYPNDYLWISMD